MHFSVLTAFFVSNITGVRLSDGSTVNFSMYSLMSILINASSASKISCQWPGQLCLPNTGDLKDKWANRLLGVLQSYTVTLNGFQLSQLLRLAQPPFPYRHDILRSFPFHLPPFSYRYAGHDIDDLRDSFFSRERLYILLSSQSPAFAFQALLLIFFPYLPELLGFWLFKLLCFFVLTSSLFFSSSTMLSGTVDVFQINILYPLRPSSMPVIR